MNFSSESVHGPAILEVTLIHVVNNITIIEAPEFDEECDGCPDEQCIDCPNPCLDYDSDMVEHKINDEVWREYDFDGRVYCINSPVLLHYRKGGTTHRVVDVEGIAHCVPAPGVNGCVLRWKSRDPNVPCAF